MAILSTQTYVQMVFQMDLNRNEILVNGPGMVAYAFDPNTLEAEEADLCELQANLVNIFPGQPELHSVVSCPQRPRLKVCR